MKSVLLVDAEIPPSEAIKELISERGLFSCKRTAIDDLFDIGVLNSDQFSAAVFDCGILDESELRSVMKLSKAAPDLPIILVASQIALDSYRRFDSLKNTVAIQKGFKPEIFQTLLEKVCYRAHTKTEISSRFITDEAVRVMLMGSGVMLNSRMRNYSSTGLFLEYRGFSLKIGDDVRVSLPSPSLGKVREHLHLKARVVWERSFADPLSPARGVGLKIR